MGNTPKGDSLFAPRLLALSKMFCVPLESEQLPTGPSAVNG